MKHYLPYLAGIGVALTWGLSFMFTKGALDYISTFHLLGLRFATAALTLALLRLFKIIVFKLDLKDYLYLLPLSIFQPILYFAAENTGVMLTSASYAGMMIAVIPIFVAVLSALILREYPNHIQAIFIAASVSGVIFIVYMDSLSLAGINPLGTLSLLGAVIAAACYNIASRKASKKYKPIEITWVMMLMGAVSFNLISLYQQFPAITPVDYLIPFKAVWLPVIYLGIAASVCAFFLFNYVLSKVTATQGSVFANLVTVIAIAAGILFRDEIVRWYHLAGTALVLLGVWGTNRFAQPPSHNGSEPVHSLCEK